LTGDNAEEDNKEIFVLVLNRHCLLKESDEQVLK
jgi:hypothetical protein